MQRRHLGRSGFSVSSIGLGLMGMSDFYGSRDRVEALRTIHHAIEKGMTFLDTADVYGMGENEKLLGEAIKDHSREKLVIATKCGIVLDPSTGNFQRVNGSPEHIRKSCENSLLRLGVETIDLYYLHRVDPNIPIEESMGAMADLVREGKIRAVGLSEANPSDIRKAHRVHPVTALQSEYSLFTRDVEVEVLGTTRELGIGFVAYSPFSRGLLTGKVLTSDLSSDDLRNKNARFPRFLPENFQHNFEHVRKLEEIARRTGATPVQICLSWLLAQGPDIVPIPGTSRRDHLNEILATLDHPVPFLEFVHLDEIFPRGIAKGERYSEEGMKRVYQAPLPVLPAH
ncbi:MAG: aldo/keto reductase [Leptospirales bacterium]